MRVMPVGLSSMRCQIRPARGPLAQKLLILLSLASMLSQQALPTSACSGTSCPLGRQSAQGGCVLSLHCTFSRLAACAAGMRL